MRGQPEGPSISPSARFDRRASRGVSSASGSSESRSALLRRPRPCSRRKNTIKVKTRQSPTITVRGTIDMGNFNYGPRSPPWRQTSAGNNGEVRGSRKRAVPPPQARYPSPCPATAQSPAKARCPCADFSFQSAFGLKSGRASCGGVGAEPTHQAVAEAPQDLSVAMRILVKRNQAAKGSAWTETGAAALGPCRCSR